MASVLQEPYFQDEAAAFERLEAIGQKPEITLVDAATITGRLYALAEAPSGVVHARIRPRNGSNYIACTAEGEIAHKLSEHFMTAVRVQGKGIWKRGEAGEWTCQSVRIGQVEGIKDVSLREAINALRAIQADWPDDPLREWAELEEKDSAA